MANSIWDSVRRIAQTGKLNTYTEFSSKTADDLGIPSNPVTRGTNDSRDAFRHSYSSAVMTDKYGETVSRFFGYANEEKNHLPNPKKTLAEIGERYVKAVSAFSGQTPVFKNSPKSNAVKPEEEWMDYYNNSKGREIAKQVEARGGSEDDLKQEIAKAVANNDLVLTPFDPRRTYDEHGDFDKAVQESEQQMVASWQRDLAEISEGEMSAADKQEARRKLDERYQEYERQFNQIIEKERAKKGAQGQPE